MASACRDKSALGRDLVMVRSLLKGLTPLMSVMRVSRISAATLTAVVASAALIPEASAQDPLITATPILETQARINRADIQSEGLFELTWTVPNSPILGYEWELTYDNFRTEIAPTQEFVVLPNEPTCDVTTDECRGELSPAITYAVRISPEQLLPDEAKTEEGARGQRDIYLRTFRSGSFNDLEVDTFLWRFPYDTALPNPLPITAVAAGDKELTVVWDATAAPEEIERVDVGLCLTPATSSVAADQVFCDNPKMEDGSNDNGQISFSDDTLENDEFYIVALRSRDDFGNTGPWGPISIAQPIDLIDFFEAYKQNGGAEDGGNCFIATAAHGSYAHPTVKVLRVFRDEVLSRFGLGQVLIEAYYASAPPIAYGIAKSPRLAAATRLALIPVALVALIIMLLPFIGLITLGFLVSKRVGRRTAATAVMSLLVFGALGASEANAQERLKSDLRWFGVGIEFRGGPYSPELAKSDTAFRQIFASTEDLERVKQGEMLGDLSKPLLSLGLEAQVYRGLGTVSVGGSFGYASWSGKALLPGTAMQSTSDNSFSLLPMTLTATYRFDWLVDNTQIPLVPYVRGGFAYYRWWIKDGRGDVPRVNGQSGKGGTTGLTGSLGVSFLLNFLEPRAARALRDSTGIRGTYLFAEFNANKVDNFSEQGFDFSDATWNIGMFLEL